PARRSDPRREPRVAGALDGLARAAEEPGLERLQALLARERLAVLGAPVALRHREVVLERGVRMLERVVELVALEEIVPRLRRVPVAQVRVDDATDRPDGAGLALDPDRDPLLPPRIVHPMEHPLRKPTAVGGDLHEPTIQSLPC